MTLAYDANGNFGIAGFTRIREIQKGDLKSGDIGYTQPGG